MHQGAWLVWALCAGMVAIATTNPFYLIPLLAAACLVSVTRRVPGPGIRSFKLFLAFAALAIVIRTALVALDPIVASTPITRDAIAAAFLEGLRLGVLLAVFGAFNSVSDPFGIVRLSPRRFHEPALAAALALSIAPRTIDAIQRVREAQAMRGIRISRWRSLPALAVPVLESGLEESVTLAESMDARGHGSGRRSRYRPERWGLSAWATTMASIAAVGLFLGFGAAGRGEIDVSTFPLHWPHVSAILVVATLLVAAPAVLPTDGMSR